MSIGEQVKVFHCTTGKDNDRLYIKRTDDGYLYFCHHCGWRGGIRKSNSNYSKAQEKIAQHKLGDGPNPSQPINIRKKPTLPFDSVREVREWPNRAKVWVYGGQLTDTELNDYGFVYSNYYDRVFFPVYNNNVISCTIGRKLKDDDSPKYLITKASDFNNLWYSNPNNSDVVCIVEDVLSAIRCSRFVAGAALLGTNFTDGAISFLIKRHKKFIIFLDDDKPQVKMKQVALQRTLQLFGEVVLITKTGKDPKKLSDEELKELLCI